MFLDNSEDEACQLCQKNIKIKDYPSIVNKALGRKYCTNLNQFFYIKDVNKVLQNSRYCKLILGRRQSSTTTSGRWTSRDKNASREFTARKTSTGNSSE